MLGKLKSGSLIVNLLLILSLLFLTLGQIGRIQIGEWPVYLYLFEPFIAICTVVLIIKLRKKSFEEIKQVAMSSLIFLAWMAISLLLSTLRYNSEQNIIAFLYLLRLAMYLVFFIYLYLYLATYNPVKVLIQKVIPGLSILIVLFSLVQYFLYPNLGNLAYLGWDPHLDRLVGLFFDPPLTISIYILMGLYLFLSFDKPVFRYFSLGIMGILSILTFSRGGYLALAVTSFIYIFRFINPRKLLIAAAVIGLVYVLLPSDVNESINLKRTTSIFTRINDYEKAISIWKEHPLEGIGYNHIRYEKDQYSEELITEKYNPSHAAASFHSSFLIILVTGGVIGFILYLWLLWQTALLNQFSKFSLIFLSVISLTDNVLLHPFVLLLLGVLVAAFEKKEKVIRIMLGK